MTKDFDYQSKIPIISTRILIDLTRKFSFVHFQSEFQLIQPEIFLNQCKALLTII